MKLKESLLSILQNCMLASNDVRNWNNNNPSISPIDGEWFQVTEFRIREAIKALDDGNLSEVRARIQELKSQHHQLADE